MFETMRRKRRGTMLKTELNQGAEHFRRAAAIAAQQTSTTVGTRFYAARDRVQPVAGRAKSAATSGWGSAVSTITPLVTAATGNVKQVGRDSAKSAADDKKATKKFARANRKAVEKNARKLEKRTVKAAAKNQKSGRGSTLLGIALLGSALGAGAAYVLRRRQAAQWDEYDPAEPLTPAASPVSVGAAGTQDAAFQPTDQTEYSTPAGTVYDSNPAVPGDETLVVVEETTVLDDPATLSGDTADQTSSAQHSPKVARMASGHNTKE